jgi:hypothetical protein
MSNRLAQEQSPYLLQHKDNPVDWFPWSEDAFRRAEEEDKPIFLSIGYSTCHWCHVMEHESFENEEVARLMNDAFIPIKVDREERPDVDGVYMTVCQMMTGQGGWPLTIIMTPDKRPFHAATYIPRESRFGRVGMLDLVPRIKDVWENRREDVLKTAGQVTGALERTAQASAAGPEPTEERLHDAFRQLEERFDSRYGGFGSAPKFPSPHNLLFLLRYWHRTDTRAALDMVTTTLDFMRLGGIFDHVGFGFHRYATDRTWLLPHFEKMLYDQALLAIAYTEAHQATSRADYRRTTEEIIEYVLRDMRSPEGGFYSAEDADSEGREGKFYVWTVEEVHEVLATDEAALIVDVFGLRKEGNFDEEATGERTGENVLHLEQKLETVARDRDENPVVLRQTIENARWKLFDRRAQRIRPGRDDKILADWNGLMIAALAKASAAFDDPLLAQTAGAAAGFVLREMRDNSGRLLHRFRNGEAAISGHLDDYAYMIWGLLELYEASFDPKMLSEALDLNRHLVTHFWDDTGGGFYFTADDAESLLVRRKEFYDGAVPSGNAVAMHNLLRLERITGDAGFGERASKLAKSAGDALGKMPSGFTALLSAVDFALGPTLEVVIAGRAESPDTAELARAVQDIFLPNKVLLFRSSDENDEIIKIAPFVAAHTTIDDRATAYVCRNFTCDAPVTSATDLMTALLQKRTV